MKLWTAHNHKRATSVLALSKLDVIFNCNIQIKGWIVDVKMGVDEKIGKIENLA